MTNSNYALPATGTEMGTYTVWYMVFGDENHNNTTPQFVEVTIVPDDLKDPNEPTNPGNPSNPDRPTNPNNPSFPNIPGAPNTPSEPEDSVFVIGRPTEVKYIEED